MTTPIPGWSEHIEYCLHADRARGLSPRTLDGRASSLRAFARWCRAYGLTTPCTVTADDMTYYASELHRAGERGRPLMAATRRNRLTVVRLFFRWWSNASEGRADPCRRLVLPRCPRTLPHRALDARDMQALRDACHARATQQTFRRALVEFLLASGVRRSECTALNVGDVDLLARWVRIKHGKGGRSRVVPVSHGAVRWLKRYLSERRYPAPDAPLFVTITGRRWIPARLSDVIARLLRRAGIGGKGACHRLRHTLATTMLANGADIRHIQAMLGHADISTTMIYASVQPLALRAVYDKTHPGVRRRAWRKLRFT